MQNIVILGVARSGKTTLSRMIANQLSNYHILNGDCIRSSFQAVFPNIMTKENGERIMPEEFSFFCSELLKHEIKENRNYFNYILESCDISPKNAIRYFQTENTIIYFLGYPDLTIPEIIHNYKFYAEADDYMVKKSDKEIEERAKFWLMKSKEIQMQCNKYNIRFINISKDRITKFEQIIQELILKEKI